MWYVKIIFAENDKIYICYPDVGVYFILTITGFDWTADCDSMALS